MVCTRVIISFVAIFLLEGEQSHTTATSRSHYQKVINILNEYEGKFQARKDADEKNTLFEIVRNTNKKEKNELLKKALQKTLRNRHTQQTVAVIKYRNGMIKVTLKKNVKTNANARRLKILKLQLAELEDMYNSIVVMQKARHRAWARRSP